MAETNSEKLRIRLHIYDTEMPLNIVKEDEALYRQAAKLINNTINTYASLFKGKTSDKEILYMALIDIALRHEKEADRNDTEPYSDIITTLTKEIEDTLSTER